MTNKNIYADIAERTNGDIYIGVVGPVRTGKSTLIKRFMDNLVIPNITEKSRSERATDELPQSAAGRTIMTTEPKFIPEEAVEIVLDGNASMNVRMIDCVGYIVPSALGYIENDMPRMIQTPWLEEPIPFNMAAEIGTKKVISEHSTIGLVVTTDGSITDIPREEYEEAEERVVTELTALGKPFVVILNCMDPDSEDSYRLAKELSDKYGTSVIPVNCQDLTEEQIRDILALVLFEFPVSKIELDMPKWILGIEKTHWLRSDIFGKVRDGCEGIVKLKDVSVFAEKLGCCENIGCVHTNSIDLGKGSVRIDIELDNSLFYKVIGEKTGLDISTDADLLTSITELSDIRKKYDKIKEALDQVEETGYGIVMPSIDELSLEEPEMMKQGGRYGVRLRASAPSIHMLRANIMTEVAPIVGSEKQSEELVVSMMSEFEDSPSKIWESNIFGKSLHELVNEGLHAKLAKMPPEARAKLRETIERVTNEGCNGLICIII